jgi:quercetin dioxygenase-like cupin family protein
MMADLSKPGTIAASGELEVRIEEVPVGGPSPWLTGRASLTLVGMAGTVAVDTVDPDYTFHLRPGQLYTVPPGLTYRIGNDTAGPARYLRFAAGGPYAPVETEGPADHRSAIATIAVSADFDRAALAMALDEDWGAYTPGLVRLDTVAKAPGLRIIVQSLGPWQCVPWHRHDVIADSFFCLDQPMRVETRDPRRSHVLLPGETLTVPKGMPHFVSGVAGGPSRALLVQGVGQYNHVPVPA